ncbi:MULTISPECIES: hypothetical protein [Romboutsia]|uniref:Uncharacterized protein n=1 Tax=Romboutsia hominis TaxID=1507512 RepID=A0A2P2BSE6_9FIRM|nr:MULTISPECIES: hypothetical protein [Romboutsia]MCH1960559.1 hypothetical protein [Romboutsia hominis]MCH1969008.1 hypothetical protein [Romboutsia hominis]MDB8790251.1 hypothetical protein [Romboutsia sp. 1001216sp1]MDB8793499.1 hypothetical protein [Romboutsia sp. 1001216sp1]MDB8797041.1 hypothetical protein [Romboutsia sp. 1001216sp1]
MALGDYDFLVGVVSTFIITSSYEISIYTINQARCIVKSYKYMKHNNT